MDLKSGFWQVKVSEDSHQYTAFTVGNMGVYEFLRMPYGLCNTPVMFQRRMQNCLGELNLSFAMVYLDNMVMYSKMPEDHLTWLQAIFDCFAHHGLKLKPIQMPLLQRGDNISWATRSPPRVCSPDRRAMKRLHRWDPL